MAKADSLSSPIEVRLCPVKWPRLSLAAAVSVPVYPWPVLRACAHSKNEMVVMTIPFVISVACTPCCL